MREYDLVEGLNILGQYRKPGFNLDAEHDVIGVGTTDIPLDEEDFDKLISLGFSITDSDVEYSEYLDTRNTEAWYCYT